MNFEAIIGLEIHVELKTKTKMFSRAAIDFNAAPNTLVSPTDLALPGTLPLVNKRAVEFGIRVGNALHMDIAKTLIFDRKNYFYSDLTKGYQITQNRLPLGSDGYLDLEIDGTVRHVRIERAHLEEDTAKQIHTENATLIDYNRAGIPLIEIVSYPDLRSGAEAALYLDTIRQIVTYSEVSDGKMEEGSLRCDINISLRPYGSDKFGTKVEVKNLNSISNVERAINYEIKRQGKLLLKGEQVTPETRRYDDALKTTVAMRLKDEKVDYKYFPESNIPPISLSDEFIENAIESSPELASEKKVRYLSEYGLSDYDADMLLLTKDNSEYFDEATKYTTFYKTLSNWLIVEIPTYLNKTQTTIDKFPIEPKRIAELVNLIESGDISNKQAREVFQFMLSDKDEPREIANKHNLLQISDPEVIRKTIKEVLAENPNTITDYKNGKDRAFGFLIGKIMGKSRGKFNPALTSKLLKEEIDKY
jgi:aspartyl-tRNA(Asn)/glutamyl-tRNA(Gln) amidotransferase subunit B